MPESIPGVKPLPPNACKWCGKPALGDTYECYSCWELRVRIQMDLKLAEEIIEVLKVNKLLEEGE